MGALEIVVLVASVIVFVVSFLLPDSVGGSASEETKNLAKEEIKALVSQEMSGIKSHVEDVVDESISYAVEKTERSLERLTNEKIMAVNEYSDTVLKEIQKNHEEVLFLYDMLNSKHANLQDTVSKVNRTMKEAEEAITVTKENKQELQITASEPEKLSEKVPQEKSEKEAVQGSMDISFMQDEAGEQRNSNDKILELHKQGKSKVAIAKELGLGVGEVKLVIDLYKNI